MKDVRIGITGTHCSGKTTLTNDLCVRLGLPHITEVAAAFTEAQRQHYMTQYKILDRQISREKESYSFVSDRTVFDNMAYLSFYFGKHATEDKIPFSHLKAIMDLALHRITEHLILHPYSLIAFVDEYFPLEDNGDRNLDPDCQGSIFDYLSRTVFDQCKTYQIPVISISGSTEDRITQIMRGLEA